MPSKGTVKVTSRFPRIVVEMSRLSDAANKDIAEAIADEARERVPRRSGALHDAIHVEFEGDNSWAVVAGDSTAFYGHIVEFGSTRSAPRPFLIPAAEAQRAKVGPEYISKYRSL